MYASNRRHSAAELQNDAYSKSRLQIKEGTAFPALPFLVSELINELPLKPLSYSPNTD